MTRKQAVEYAIAKIPNILPLEETEIKTLCDQFLRSLDCNPDKMAQDVLDILGHSDLSFEFIIGFTEKFSAPGDKIGLEMKSGMDTSKTTSSMTLASSKPIKPKTDGHRKGKTNQRTLLLREIGQISRLLEQEPNSEDCKRFSCNCQGNLHPLFEVAPNCLCCGKIICIREGLHLIECSHCGEDIISLEERLKILQVLKQEKFELENGAPKAHEQPISKSKTGKFSYKISTGIGTNLFTEQDKLFDLLERQKQRERKREVLRDGKITEIYDRQKKQDNIDADLVYAQERLDKLLYFQDTSAERTKIIDNASDFSMGNDCNNIWGTAKERALLLKKQQRKLRNWEKMENERNGRRNKYAFRMDIGSNGKVTMTEVPRNKVTLFPSDDEMCDVNDEEDVKDLRIIHDLKNEIKSDKIQQVSALENKLWDYKRDKNKFRKALYISDNTNNVSYSTRLQSHERRIESRVQADENDENLWDRLV